MQHHYRSTVHMEGAKKKNYTAIAKEGSRSSSKTPYSQNKRHQTSSTTAIKEPPLDTIGTTYIHQNLKSHLRHFIIRKHFYETKHDTQKQNRRFTLTQDNRHEFLHCSTWKLIVKVVFCPESRTDARKKRRRTTARRNKDLIVRSLRWPRTRRIQKV